LTGKGRTVGIGESGLMERSESKSEDINALHENYKLTYNVFIYRRMGVCIKKQQRCGDIKHERLFV